MADNLFDLAAASEAAKQQAASADFLADADFGAFLDPAKGYTFQELQDEYASFRAARELAGEGLDDEDDDVERDMSKCSYALGYIKQEARAPAPKLKSCYPAGPFLLPLRSC